MADEIKMSAQQVSHVVAACLLVSFFIFVAGYYWGKKSSIGPLTDQLKAEALSDKVYNALCSLDNQNCAVVLADERTGQSSNKEAQEHYYALLARHSSLKALQIWTQKLKQQGLSVRIVEHVGKTAKGQARTWYELLSQTYTNKQELEKHIEQMKKLVPLHTIEIMSLNA